MVDVDTIITLGFYQRKRVLASSTIIGLICKLYLKVHLREGVKRAVILSIPWDPGSWPDSEEYEARWRNMREK
jgi:hypothetical protein